MSARIYTLLFAGVILALTACSTPGQPGIKVEYKTVEKEVPRPCPVTKPVTPEKLKRPLPKDPARLLDLVTAKLLEWAGPGGYGERANAAIETCTKP